MNIPEQFKKQCSERASLIAGMMADGAITTPIEFLEAPMLLMMHMTDAYLLDMLKRVMRTRKRGIPFGLNGRLFVLTRKAAIAVVKEEIKSRGL